MIYPTLRRGGQASDSETPTFFAFVGVDLEARWELNTGVLAREMRGITKNIKTKQITKNKSLGHGYSGIETDL